MSEGNADQIARILSAQLDAWGADAFRDTAPQAETLLTSQEIIELKAALSSESELAASVCTHIAINSALDIEHNGELTGKPAFDSREEFTYEAAMLAIEYSNIIGVAIGLPADEWPRGCAGPDVFSEALSDVREAEAPQEDQRG